MVVNVTDRARDCEKVHSRAFVEIVCYASLGASRASALVTSFYRIFGGLASCRYVP
jgi:hypothetical protein